MLLLYLSVDKIVCDLLTDNEEELITGVEASSFAMKMTQTSFWNRKVGPILFHLLISRSDWNYGILKYMTKEYGARSTRSIVV